MKESRTRKASTMDSDSWCSPPAVGDPLEQFFGGPVGTDPCSNDRSIIKANVAYHAGGLHLPWWTPPAGKRTAYENFPFSKPLPWTVKMLHELDTNLEEHVRLGPVSTSTLWWRTMCGIEDVVAPKKRRPNPRLLFTGRIKFMGDVGFGARFDCVLAYWGSRTAEFDKAFAHLTKWSSWGRT